MTVAAMDRKSADILGGRLYQYGAAELKRLQPLYLRRALLLACLIALTAEGVALLAAGFLSRPQPAPTAIVYIGHILRPPPSLAPNQVTQMFTPSQPAAPAMATPIPVPNADAPPDLTTAKQEEFRDPGPATSTIGETRMILVAPEPPDPDPKEVVYVEELPVPITRVQPVYPEIARQSGLEGTVMVKALVGTDGRVKNVLVERSIPILDDAAVKAVRQWVFKPAISSNRPVKVWVMVPVRFTLH